MFFYFVINFCFSTSQKILLNSLIFKLYKSLVSSTMLRNWHKIYLILNPIMQNKKEVK